MTDKLKPIDGICNIIKQPTNVCCVCNQDKVTDLRIGSTYTCIDCLEKFYKWAVLQFKRGMKKHD